MSTYGFDRTSARRFRHLGRRAFRVLRGMRHRRRYGRRGGCCCCFGALMLAVLPLAILGLAIIF